MEQGKNENETNDELEHNEEEFKNLEIVLFSYI